MFAENGARGQLTMTRLEFPSSPIAVPNGPDGAAAVGLASPHDGLLIVGRVVGVSNVDPGGRRHCYSILFCFVPIHKTQEEFVRPRDVCF